MADSPAHRSFSDKDSDDSQPLRVVSRKPSFVDQVISSNPPVEDSESSPILSSFIFDSADNSPPSLSRKPSPPGVIMARRTLGLSPSPHSLLFENLDSSSPAAAAPGTPVATQAPAVRWPASSKPPLGKAADEPSSSLPSPHVLAPGPSPSAKFVLPRKLPLPPIVATRSPYASQTQSPSFANNSAIQSPHVAALSNGNSVTNQAAPLHPFKFSPKKKSSRDTSKDSDDVPPVDASSPPTFFAVSTPLASDFDALSPSLQAPSPVIGGAGPHEASFVYPSADVNAPDMSDSVPVPPPILVETGTAGETGAETAPTDTAATPATVGESVHANVDTSGNEEHATSTANAPPLLGPPSLDAGTSLHIPSPLLSPISPQTEGVPRSTLSAAPHSPSTPVIIHSSALSSVTPLARPPSLRSASSSAQTSPDHAVPYFPLGSAESPSSGFRRDAQFESTHASFPPPGTVSSVDDPFDSVPPLHSAFSSPFPTASAANSSAAAAAAAAQPAEQFAHLKPFKSVVEWNFTEGHRMIGQRVCILFKPSRLWSGIVGHYNSYTNEHLVYFDAREFPRWINMAKCTFLLEPETVNAHFYVDGKRAYTKVKMNDRKFDELSSFQVGEELQVYRRTTNWQGQVTLHVHKIVSDAAPTTVAAVKEVFRWPSGVLKRQASLQFDEEKKSSGPAILPRAASTPVSQSRPAPLQLSHSPNANAALRAVVAGTTSASSLSPSASSPSIMVSGEANHPVAQTPRTPGWQLAAFFGIYSPAEKAMVAAQQQAAAAEANSLAASNLARALDQVSFGDPNMMNTAPKELPDLPIAAQLEELRKRREKEARRLQGHRITGFCIFTSLQLFIREPLM